MNSSFEKFEGNPVLGGPELGTCFDVIVTRDGGRYRMDFSWRPKASLAVSFSDDGVHWSYPEITLAPDPDSGWEDRLNRNCVLLIDGKYKMWYTGQARGHSYIGYAESDDGIHFTRPLSEPVLISEYPWEGFSVMNPSVLYENGVYRMWYASGETYEPNVLAYAESTDGINWKKARINPIVARDPEHVYEQDRVGGCQVLHTEDMGYLMFYIGYENIDLARICMARSKNGITGWERSESNPIVSPTPDAWDADACYKPSVLWNEEMGAWMLWYNGRRGTDEYVGLVIKRGRELF